MSESNDAQRKMYAQRAKAYEQLISAEDCDGLLRKQLLDIVTVDKKRIVDIGAGTGRLARWFTKLASKLVLVEREEAMLAIAKEHLGDAASYHTADARSLPLQSDTFDVATAGWVFAHFRHWMPENWKEEVDAAIAEMKRVTVSSGSLVIIETLGTGHTSPRNHPGLDEYFEHIENEHGFTRTWARSDYSFASVDEAIEVLGPFFGDSLVDKIKENQWSVVPECTAIFVASNHNKSTILGS